MSGQIQKKRGPGGSDDNDPSQFTDMLGELPTAKAQQAEDAIRAAREAARKQLERKIDDRRKKEAEEVCSCW